MPEAMVCTICGEPVEEKTSSVCNSCGERFHLNQRNDVPGKDCGAVWVSDEYLALEFACQRCLDGERRAPQRPVVLQPRPGGRRRYRKRDA